MTTAKQLLDEKGYGVSSVHPDRSVLDAIQQMSDENIGSLVVMDDDKLVGIITERHYARNVFLKGRSSQNTRVREIMATDAIHARPDQVIEECMAIMTAKAVRHLPVVDQGQLIGIVSIGDLVNSIIRDREFTIHQLEHYINH